MTTQTHSPASHLLLRPHLGRIVESVLFLVNKAQERKQTLTQYEIVKAIFLADRAHLNNYGRPITFDNYVAMVHGPVPSTTYNILKEEASTVRRYGRKLPWKRRPAPEISNKSLAFHSPARTHDSDVLSDSDVKALEEALTIVKALDFKQIRKITHEDAAYEAAWNDEGGRQQYPMNYSLLFGIPNGERAEELSFLSRHL